MQLFGKLIRCLEAKLPARRRLRANNRFQMLFLKIKNLYNDNTVNNITRTIMSFVVEEIDYKYISENTPNCGEKNLLQGTPVTQVSHLGRGDKLCGTRSDQRTGL